MDILLRVPQDGAREEDMVDSQTRLFLWILASAGCFAMLLGLFGAVTGAVNWSQGRQAGTVFGLSVVRAFRRLSEEELRPAAAGALVGGADGIVFGVMMGTLIGLFAGWHVPAEWQILRPILLTAGLLVGLAVALGLFAGVIQVIGVRAVLGLFLGGMTGATLGAAWNGLDGLFFGTLAGAAIGVGLIRLRS